MPRRQQSVPYLAARSKSRRRFLQSTVSGIATLGVIGTASANEEDVQEIGDWYDLDAVREDLDGEYVLVDDIDANSAGYGALVEEPEGGWEPIGTDDDRFAGTFDGNGHEIADLRIDSAYDRFNVGLFSVVDGHPEGRIEQLHLSDVDIDVAPDTGNVGSLVGKLRGVIVGCSATGTVVIDAPDLLGGGLVGLNISGRIADSTAEVDVSNPARGPRSLGGLVGGNFGGEVSNSHYDVEAVELDGENHLTIGGVFPDQFEDWQDANRALAIEEYDSLDERGDTIHIDEIQGIRDALGFIQDPSFDWTLGADLDLSTTTPGLYLPYLAGGFDGNGHVVTLDVDVPGENAGFIGYHAGDTIRSLEVRGNVAGTEYVGGLVGHLDAGDVIDIQADVVVDGGDRTGGLVGYATGETIERCAADGPVGGTFRTGGLVGQLRFGEVLRSEANGTVSGELGAVGGLAGQASGDIMHAAAHGDVTGDGEGVGGAVGRMRRSSTARGMLATGTVSGADAVGGLVGQLGRFLDADDEVVLRDSYWDVERTGLQDAVGEIDEGDGTAAVSGDVTGLETAEMQGADADMHMPAFDFEDVWVLVADPPDYPTLAWRASTDRDPDDDPSNDTSEDIIDGEDDPDDDPDDTERYDRDRDDTSDDDDETDDALPGFGLGTAVTGLGGVAYLLRRRGQRIEEDAS